ncbi:DUF2975 domain-containing protein [Halobacillus sp. A5]|uniref:DUF2975 domain-containing protein n=1 Tax=Halobacillus sp. A5 TaxID=2880263 RepID=UPI0020A671A0|nr:DUF2975 domain-containing protein [Halobacillus sp. A5]MCP3027762.1 DUF2975 domain-containing protein [Halobacillus sp. A5]
MKQGSTLFLKAAVFLIGALVLALCIFLLPKVFSFGGGSEPELVFVYYFMVIIMYLASIPFFTALYQALKLLRYIDRNEAFSALSVRSLQVIKYCAFTISGLYTAGLPFLYLIAQDDDAPGIIVIGLVIIFASTVIGVFAAVLQILLKNAIEIKSENDLTV